MTVFEVSTNSDLNKLMSKKAQKADFSRFSMACAKKSTKQLKVHAIGVNSTSTPDISIITSHDHNSVQPSTRPIIEPYKNISSIDKNADIKVDKSQILNNNKNCSSKTTLDVVNQGKTIHIRYLHSI